MIQRMFLNGQEKLEVGRIISENTGYGFKSTILLSQIFRRSSLAAETGKQSNEIFEFTGDRILSNYVVKYITKRLGGNDLNGDYIFKIRENKFSQILQDLTNNQTLANIIDKWDIAKYLLVGRCDIKNLVINETKVKADLFEAILGGIAIETQWDDAILEKAVIMSLDLETKVNALIESDCKARRFDLDNAITTLKEIAENGQCTMPVYEFLGTDSLGYDENGNPKWQCNCHILNDKLGINKTVNASSKKEAKKAAAYLVLCEHLEMQNKYGPNDWYIIWTYKDGKLIPDRSTSK